MVSRGEGFLPTITQIRASQNKQMAMNQPYFVQFKIYKCHVILEALSIRMVYERSCVNKIADFTMDNANLCGKKKPVMFITSSQVSSLSYNTTV